MFRILVGIIVFVTATSAAAWFTLKSDDIPFEALETTYEGYASDYFDMPDGVRLHYRDDGPPDSDRVLLLIHGYGGSLHTWEPWVRRLDGQFRLISIDLPAHGLTRAPEDYAPTIEGYVDLVDAFAEALNLNNFVLAGSSMGGNVAWTYALAHPERLDGLVLIGASGWTKTDGDAVDDTLLIRLAKNPVIAPLLVKIDTSDQVRDTLERSFVDQTHVTDDAVRRYSELSRAPGHRSALMSLLIADRTMADKAALSAIEAPTLILHGDGDAMAPVEGARLFEDAITRSTLVVYEGVGHLPHEEVPGESANDLLAFLKQVYPPASDDETPALTGADDSTDATPP